MHLRLFASQMCGSMQFTHVLMTNRQRPVRHCEYGWVWGV